MKALTLTQPWCTLVALGAKKIETRSWPTSYRGPLAIHAAKGFPAWAREFACSPPCYQAMVRQDPDRDLREPFPDYPLGVVLATCRLVACIRTEVVSGKVSAHLWGTAGGGQLTAQERAFGDYSPGRWAWVLEDVQPLAEPVAAKGQLRLWEWEGGSIPKEVSQCLQHG
jgi:hypothetical protein